MKRTIKLMFLASRFWPARLHGFLLMAAGFVAPGILFSQTFTNSPYSRFGLGELQYGGLAHNFSMGGIYNALRSDTTAPFYLNPFNPASHASLRITSFDAGLKSTTMRLETTGKKFSSNQTSLSHLAIGFPFGNIKWWGSSFGLLPYSAVGYKIYDTTNVDSIGKVNYSYMGDGGINQFYWGNGFRIKDFSVGVNTAYLFGDLIYASRDSFPKASNFFNTKFSQTRRVSGMHFTFGAQYKMNTKSNWSLTLGATFAPEKIINAKMTTFAAIYEHEFGVEVMKDTIINEEDQPGDISIPAMFGGGVVLKKGDQWLIGIDYSMQNWSAFQSHNQQNILKNSQRIAAGVQYVPNKGAGVKEPYGKKMYYRAGIRYSDSYLDASKLTAGGSAPLNDMAFSIGAGFPLRKTKVGQTYSQSVINVGLEFGSFGTVENNLIRERYARAVLSFTFNDRWFIKRKYD